MNYQEWKEGMEKKGMPIPKPMDLLAQMDINRVLAHQADKQAAYSGDALPQKVKSLIAIGVGIALDSPACILNNTKAAKAAGATTAEIIEAFAVAKFAKGASAISASLAAFEWLAENK